MKKSDVKMEDINLLMLALYDELTKRTIILSRKEMDEFDKKLSTALEEFFNNPDYRNYN